MCITPPSTLLSPSQVHGHTRHTKTPTPGSESVPQERWPESRCLQVPTSKNQRLCWAQDCTGLTCCTFIANPTITEMPEGRNTHGQRDHGK